MPGYDGRMEDFLAGKIALVTGGTRGIGRAIVRRLAESGATVAFCGRSSGGVAQAVAEFSGNHKVLGLTADVKSGIEVEGMVAEAVRTLGGLDILINNAGIGWFAPVAELTAADWERVISTNLSGVFHCCRAAIPHLRVRGGGDIINVSSLAGRNPFAGGAAYNASKFGLNGFTEAMMLDHRHENIRVGLIAPGSVDTEFSPRRKPETVPEGPAWKIAPEDVAEAALAMLRMPRRTALSLIELRPSRPPRS